MLHKSESVAGVPGLLIDGMMKVLLISRSDERFR
jgi:hypothetical protein